MLVLLAWSMEADAYADGAPDDSCDSLLPRHHGNAAQDGTAAYTLTTSATQVAPGGKLTVTLSSTDAAVFMGFIMQARSTKTDEAVGKFTTIPDLAQALTCNVDADTVTHDGSDDKDTLVFQWQAPTDVTDPVLFTATVLEDFSTFYADIKSKSVKIAKKTSSKAKSKTSSGKSKTSSGKSNTSSGKSNTSSGKSKTSSAAKSKSVDSKSKASPIASGHDDDY